MNSEEDEAIQTVIDALAGRDPQLLLGLSAHFSTWKEWSNSGGSYAVSQ
jgi:hypothetical protein